MECIDGQIKNTTLMGCVRGSRLAIVQIRGRHISNTAAHNSTFRYSVHLRIYAALFANTSKL